MFYINFLSEYASECKLLPWVPLDKLDWNVLSINTRVVGILWLHVFEFLQYSLNYIYYNKCLEMLLKPLL
jgi:hypothetical protein